MAGRVINIAPRQTYTFTTPASSNTVVPLGARAYQATDVVSGTLILRVSSGTSMQAGSNLRIVVANVSISPDEPDVTFSPASATLAQVQANQGDTFPQLYTAGWSGGTGSMIQVAMSNNQGATAGLNTIICSVDLVLRDA